MVDPNATPPSGPVKVKIDAIEPEAGPTTGNLIHQTNFI